MVVYSVIPATREEGIRRIRVQGQPHQKISESLLSPISTNKLGVVTCTCDPCYVGSKNRRIKVQASLGKKARKTLFKK
jgi:hypothetical protein